MAYSKETERENKALGDLLKGKTPEKRVMVGYKGKEKEKGDIVPKMTELMQGVRMPLFCKKCDKIMKQRLDDKMWRLYGHCFDCQIQVENKMRINGTFNGYAKKKVLENKKSWIKEQIQGIEEWKNQDDVVFYNQINPEVGIVDEEKYNVDKEHIKQMANEALEELNEMMEEVRLELGNTITG